MRIEYEGITSDKIRDCFETVMNRYEVLHDCRVTLRQKRLKSSTMQAQPVIKFKNLFTDIKEYHVDLGIYLRDSTDLLVADLPEKVLIGWFAHELGHVVDYLPYSNAQMIAYGLKYISSESFRKKAEHAADIIAIDHGFYKEILETKKFILENEMLDEKYKNKIRKYYMSEDEVRELVLKQIPIHDAEDGPDLI